MKHCLYIFFTTISILFSCAKDEDITVNDSLLLPQKIFFTSDTRDIEVSFTYSGNKIISMSDSTSKLIFQYEGDFIVKSESFRVELNGEDSKTHEETLSYENGELKTYVSYDLGNIKKKVYTHISENFVTYKEYSVNSTTYEEILIGGGSLTYSNGNLMLHVEEHDNYKVETMYEYDTKNHPYKNILGFNSILNHRGLFSRSQNNTVKTTITYTSDSYTSTDIYTQKHEYNNYDYPISSAYSSLDPKTEKPYINYSY